MKFKVFLSLSTVLFLHTLHGMKDTKHVDKKAQEIYQPKSLRDRAAQVAFKLLPQQPNIDACFEATPRELIDEYINKPIDKRGRRPIYFTSNIPNAIAPLIRYGAEIGVWDTLKICPMQYFIEEGNCDAALDTLAALGVAKTQTSEKDFAYYCLRSLTPLHREKIKRIVERNAKVMHASDKEECEKLLLWENLETNGYQNLINKIIDLLKILKKYQSSAYVQGTLQPWHLTQRTALFYAQTPDEINQLVSENYPIDHQDIWGDTALLYHLKENRPECAQALIKAGATTKLADKKGKPLVIDYCIKFGFNNLLRDVFTQEMIEYLDENPREFMETAAEHNNIGAVRFLLDYRRGETDEDVEMDPMIDRIYYRKDLEEALFAAINQKNLQLCSLLLSQEELDINALDKYENSFLIKAIIRFPEFALDLLEIDDLDIFQRNEEGNDGLTVAMQEKNFPIFKKIVTSTNKDSGKNNINYQNDLGETPLMLCLREEFHEGVEFLLNSGADVTLKDNNNRTGLHYAVLGSFENLQYLLSFIQRTCPTSIESLMNDKTSAGKTPLLVLVKSSDAQDCKEKIDLLLQQPGVDINAENNKGKNALQIALEWQYIRDAKYLLERGATLNPQKVIGIMQRLIIQQTVAMETWLNNNNWCTSGDMLVRYGAMQQKALARTKALCKTIKLLSKKGFSFNIPNQENKTLLSTAIEHSSPQTIKTLLNLGISYENNDTLRAQEVYDEIHKAIACEENNLTLQAKKGSLERAQEVLALLTPTT